MRAKSKLIWILATVLCAKAYCFTQLDVSANITPDLQFSWTFNDTDIMVIVQKNRQGYACIGIGSSMSQADIIQIQTVGGVLSVSNCYLSSHNPPICNVPQTWTVVDSSISSNGFKVQLYRSINAPNSNSLTYSRVANPVIFSYTDSPSVVQHNPNQPGCQYGVKRVNFATGAISSPLTSWGDGTIKLHMMNEH